MGCGAAGAKSVQEPSAKKEPNPQETKQPESKAPEQKQKQPEEKKAEEKQPEIKKDLPVPMAPMVQAPPPVLEAKQEALGKVVHTPQMPHKMPGDETSFPPLDAATVSKIYDGAKGNGSLIRQLVDCQNLVRSKPQFVLQLLKARLEKEENNTTVQAKNLKEAIEFLGKQSPVGLLQYSPGLSLACQAHATDLASFGMVAHAGSDGSKLEVRLQKVGSFSGEIGENLDSGKTKAEDIVLSMVLDGTVQKEQRKNLFNAAFGYCGVATVEHHKLKMIIVVNYVEKFTPAA